MTLRRIAVPLLLATTATPAVAQEATPDVVVTGQGLAPRPGDKAASDKLYAGAHPMTGEDIAQTMLWVASLPAHLNINTLELMPVSQSFAGFQVSRTSE